MHWETGHHPLIHTHTHTNACTHKHTHTQIPSPAAYPTSYTTTYSPLQGVCWPLLPLLWPPPGLFSASRFPVGQSHYPSVNAVQHSDISDKTTIADRNEVLEKATVVGTIVHETHKDVKSSTDFSACVCRLYVCVLALCVCVCVCVWWGGACECVHTYMCI